MINDARSAHRQGSSGRTDAGAVEAKSYGRITHQGSATLVDALDRVSEAVVIVDAFATVIHANHAAVQLFRNTRAVSVAENGRLMLSGAEARDALMRALRGETAIAAETTPAVERVAIPRPQDRPLLLALYPVYRRSADGAVAIVVFADPVPGVGDATAALRLAYGLTPAEVRLVCALNEGLTLKEFAARSGLTYETVRSYIKRVLAKTGARGQADLVRLTRGLR